MGANVEETLALASVRDAGPSGLSDDPEAALRQIGHTTVPEPLWEIVNLGWEAEIWRRAARDPQWDPCLIAVLAGRANWLVGQERYDEIAAPARRAVGMAKTTQGRRMTVPAVAALADYDRHRGAGHAAAAEMAGAWAEGLPDDEYRAWMLQQRGLCLARMGLGDAGARLVEQAVEVQDRRMASYSWDGWTEPWRWIELTVPLREVHLAAGEPNRAAARIGGRRDLGFPAWTYVRVEHANGRAATGADMAYLRHFTHFQSDHPQGRRRLERIERRQAKLTGGEPMPYVPGPTDDATRHRLWAAVLREHRG